MENYKGGKPNHEVGEKVYGFNIVIDEGLPTDVIVLGSEHLSKLKAQDDDLLYISDARWYLGGLRSNHVKVKSKKDLKSDEIKMSKVTFDNSYFLKGRKLNIEKIF